MAGGAPQSANPSQGGQNDQISALLRNPNLPSMLQSADFSGINQQNQQALQQAYMRAQQPQMGAPQAPQAPGQMTPQMMAAAQQMQTQPGQIDQMGQLQPPPGPPPVQNTGGPDRTGALPGGGMGFDGSGSDAGVGGQPVNSVQSPMGGGSVGRSPMGNRPPMMSDFRKPRGLQIQGNPTAQPVGGGLGSLGRRQR